MLLSIALTSALLGAPVPKQKTRLFLLRCADLGQETLAKCQRVSRPLLCVEGPCTVPVIFGCFFFVLKFGLFFVFDLIFTRRSFARESVDMFYADASGCSRLSISSGRGRPSSQLWFVFLVPSALDISSFYVWMMMSLCLVSGSRPRWHLVLRVSISPFTGERLRAGLCRTPARSKRRSDSNQWRQVHVATVTGPGISFGRRETTSSHVSQARFPRPWRRGV